jgi:hypothetical protein
MVVVMQLLVRRLHLHLQALGAGPGVLLAVPVVGLAAGTLPGGGPGAVDVVADGRDAAHGAGDVVGELGHEEDIAVRHDGDGPLAQDWLVAVHYGAGEVQEVLGAAVDLLGGSAAWFSEGCV